jgi:hypothetical protein
MPHVLESSDLVVSFMSELSSHFLSSCLAANHLPWFCSCDYSETKKGQCWFPITGEAQPGDDEILRGGPQEPSRDEWMTALPPERQVLGLLVWLV